MEFIIPGNTKFITMTKHAATKEVKACREYYNDLKEAWDNRHRHGGYYGYFMGERVFEGHVREAKKELEEAIKFRESMNL